MGQPRSWQLLSRTSIQWRGPLQFYSLMQVFGRSCRNLNCAHYWQSALNCTHTCTHSLRRCMNLRQKPFKQDMAKEGAWPKGRRQDSAVAENACPRMYIIYVCTSASLHTNSKENALTASISIHSRRSTFTLNLPSLCHSHTHTHTRPPSSSFHTEKSFPLLRL